MTKHETQRALKAIERAISLIDAHIAEAARHRSSWGVANYAMYIGEKEMDKETLRMIAGHLICLKFTKAGA